jgi:succinyl-CoA synthetase beta subunit
LWIERASDITREYYLSITFDRADKQALLMFTTEGGIDIEEVAVQSPEKLARLHVDPLVGYQPFQARQLSFAAGLHAPDEQRQLAVILERLYRVFVECEAMLCEINPLIVTPEGELRALDAKVTIDDNALFRHSELAELRDPGSLPPQERLAKERGLAYVKLDGDIGILGNGAGLVMSTLDVVAQAGGRPANFCDVGGGAKAEEIVSALEVITADPVKAILFNIFGGITRGGEVAKGLLEALERMAISVPIVVRLDGTEAGEGRKLLAEAAPPNVHAEATMLEAAQRVVELAR